MVEVLLPEGALALAKEAKVGPVVAAPQAPVVLAEAAALVVATGGAEEFGRVVERYRVEEDERCFGSRAGEVRA